MTSKVTSIEDARLLKNLVKAKDVLDKAGTDNTKQFCWHCKCGCELFYVLEDGYECNKCDKIHSFESVHGSI